MNELVNSTQELTTTDVNLPNNVADKVYYIEKAQKYAIAQLASEIWLRANDGQWAQSSGSVQQVILDTFKKTPQPIWEALLIHCAVDPNGASVSPFYGRTAGERWRPFRILPRQVACRTGLYDLSSRTFAPYPDDEIIFGPLIDVQPDPEILANVRQNKLESAPEKFRALMEMVTYALEDDEATIDYFKQVVAQVLRPHAGWNQFCHIIGESGARKTTIMRALLAAPCGNQGFSEISEAVLAERYFARMGLVNRVANLSNDSATSRKFTTFIKEITSGVIQVEKKFCDIVKLPLTCKLFATTNSAQDYDDVSLGVENRLVAFRFKERHDNNRSAEGCQWMDPGFYSAVDRTWIIHWMLAGLEVAYEEGGSTAPKPSKLAETWRNALLNDASPIRAFALKYLKPSSEKRTPISDVVAWAQEEGTCGADEHSVKQFKDKLGGFLRGRFGVTSSVTKIDAKCVRFWPVELVTV